MKFGVVGYGVVGKHVETDILHAGHTVFTYDKYKSTGLRDALNHDGINACDAVFVCVSTPQAPDGSADVSAIDDVFGWLHVPVAIVRSTVPPGTTARLQMQLWRDHYVVFCPEFIGEGVNAPYVSMRQPPFLVIGGTPLAQQRAGAAFSHLYNSECEFIYTDSATAECIKYAENIYLATKVTLFNEFYDWVTKLGGNWGEFVNGLTHDYRIGRSHTHVYPDNRGWSGRCLPKDTAALLSAVGSETAPLLAAVIQVNERQRAK